MNTARFFLYLLILLLPTQLGRHFFFDFSLIAGVRSAYLAPTVYLTDIISVLIITLTGISAIKRKNFKFHPDLIGIKFPILLIGYLLFTSIFIADNSWAALYKTVKILEWSLLGWAIVAIRPRLSTMIFLLSAAGMYSAVIAGAQFLLQRSVGGWLWFVGERSFYASTPAIATMSWGGAKMLRPYATFPHPNVLGGFLAMTMSFVLHELITQWSRLSKVKRGWYSVFLLLGTGALFLAFSRMAWIVAVIGAIAVWEKETRRIVFWFSFHRRFLHFGILAAAVFSAVLPLLWNIDSQSAQQRTLLLQSAIEKLISSPLFGVGLNNSLSAFYPFQPVHNVFLLILVETGVLGFGIAWWIWTTIYLTSLKKGTWLFVVLIQLFLLGLFDHYLVTLQQGMLLATLVLSLVFLPKNTVR